MDVTSETRNAYELCSELIPHDNSNITNDIYESRQDIQYATTVLLKAKNRPTPRPHTPHSMITCEEDRPTSRPEKGRNRDKVIPGRRKEQSRRNKNVKRWKRPINSHHKKSILN